MFVSDGIFLLEAALSGVVYNGDRFHCRVYAVLEQDGITLIDSGFPELAQAIIGELEQLPGTRALKRILLTHADLDHIGGAHFLQQATGCRVFIAPAELGYLSGEKKRLPQKQRMWDNFGAPLPKLEPYLSDTIGDFTVIPTPGHTDGHVCILYEDIIFTGDLCSFIGDEFQGPNPLWTENMPLAQDSLNSLKNYNFRLLCGGHGSPADKSHYLKNCEAQIL